MAPTDPFSPFHEPFNSAEFIGSEIVDARTGARLVDGRLAATREVDDPLVNATVAAFLNVAEMVGDPHQAALGALAVLHTALGRMELATGAHVREVATLANMYDRQLRAIRGSVIHHLDVEQAADDGS